MFIENFFNNTISSTNNNTVSFTRQHGSDFAKQIADDFNPLHDIDAKRFCIPGDLLFSIILAKAGLHQKMEFIFSGMVTNDIELNFPSEIDGNAAIVDDKEKEYLRVSASGTKSTDEHLIETLIRSYVEFSGHTFPHILVKLMHENNVMINPTRPMVMYESMSIHLERLDLTEVKLVSSNSTLTLDGKRGKACLEFDLVSNNEIVGHGKKHMLLSGLREYCQDNIDVIVNDYNAKKANYLK